jgi:hypothetical protein
MAEPPVAPPGGPGPLPRWQQLWADADALDAEAAKLPFGPDRTEVEHRALGLRYESDRVREAADAANAQVEDRLARFGCTPPLMVGIAAVVIILLLGWFLLFGGDDDGRPCPGGGTPNPVTGCGQAAAPTADGPKPSAGSGSNGGTASLAGHYVLVSGLNDPDGLDEGARWDPNLPGRTRLGARSATFDIADDGAVRGGSYDTEHTRITPTCNTTITLTASSATGSFQPDGFGTVTWDGTQTTSRSCTDSGIGETAWPLQLYFFAADDQLVACRLLPGATIPTTTPTACPPKATAGRFARR